MKNYYTLGILLLLNSPCLYAQKSGKLNSTLSGNVKSLTILEYPGSDLQKETNAPLDSSNYSSKSVEFFNKNGDLDSTVTSSHFPPGTPDIVSYRAVFFYNDQHQLLQKRSFFPQSINSKSGRNEYVWLNPTTYSSRFYYNDKSGLMDSSMCYLDRQMRDSMRYATSFDGWGNVTSKTTVIFQYFTNELGQGYSMTTNYLMKNLSYKGSAQQLKPDQFNNPTLLYRYQEDGVTLESIYLITYTYYN
ncbi:MAG: hypothetical protein QE487_09715 [Fluviicola sp.]|nr:hypothetical protein [Fluviicola sp.]